MRNLIERLIKQKTDDSPARGPLAMGMFLLHLGALAGISWVLTNDNAADDQLGWLFVGLYLVSIGIGDYFTQSKDRVGAFLKLAVGLIFIFLHHFN